MAVAVLFPIKDIKKRKIAAVPLNRRQGCRGSVMYQGEAFRLFTCGTITIWCYLLTSHSNRTSDDWASSDATGLASAEQI